MKNLLQQKHIINSLNICMVFLFVCCLGLSNSKAADTWCEASFEYSYNINTAAISQEIILTNTSEGYFSTVHWLVDGVSCTGLNLNDEGGTYSFPEEGTYEVCVEVVNINSYCYSIYCEDITVGQNDPCFYSDCVYPGDANGDGKASNFDLLRIGLHYGSAGPARPNATTEWNGQTAPDWNETTSSGINLKHVDCNGDGLIDILDMFPIVNNYAMEQPNIAEGDPNDEVPDIFIEYDETEVIISENDSLIQVSGLIHAGNSFNPITDLHGLAFSLFYSMDYVQAGSFEVSLLDNSWIGAATDYMHLEVDMSGSQDLAYSRMDDLANSGYGPIASFSFVISDDLIGKRDDVILRIDFGGVVGKDQNQNDRIIDGIGSGIPIRFNTTSVRTYTPELTTLEIYPNPVKDRMSIRLNGDEAKSIRIFDVVGKEVFRKQVASSEVQLNLSGLEKGIYFMEVQTKSGNILNKRILVE